jgi:hypothetical protein
LTAAGSTRDNPAVGYFIVTVGEQREGHRSEVVGSVAQAFLGTRVGCAQCPNHPVEKYTQDDYYHFAAYFSRLTFKRTQGGERRSDRVDRLVIRSGVERQAGGRGAATNRAVARPCAARPQHVARGAR